MCRIWRLAASHTRDHMKHRAITASSSSYAFMSRIAATVLGLAWSAAWTGLTLSVLWTWFVVPNFQLPHLSIADGYGIALILRAGLGLRDGEIKGSENFADAFQTLMLTAPCGCGLFLALGYAAKAWTKAGI